MSTVEAVATRDARARTLAILSFHKIGDPPSGWDSWFYISEATFVNHLRYLVDNEWSVISLDRFLHGLADPTRLPERSALLTFDDGYRRVLDLAVPWLERFGFPAVVFVPSAFIGISNSFDSNHEPEEPICGWRELRELQRRGVAVQSHGVSHRAFSELDRAGQDAELRQSKCVLEAGLGTPVTVFAYPYGDPGPDIAIDRVVAQAGYRAACLYGGGPHRLPLRTPYRLQRVGMGPDTDLGAELATGQESSR